MHKTLRKPHVSFVLATHNRCAVVVDTIGHLHDCGLDADEYEIIVVDNASTDDTPAAVEPSVNQLVRLPRNAGSCAKADGVERARGRYIVFVDDDSWPEPGSVARMVEHFEAETRLGAAGFAVHLKGGGREGAALPGVFVGCGVGFRADALNESGGLDRSFFMQAEEYDLSFRLAMTGWRVETFDDLAVRHLKTSAARKPARTTYYDVRNNLRVIARYLPSPLDRALREDCLLRYACLAGNERDHRIAFRRGARNGRCRGAVERWTFRRFRKSADALERFYGWERIRRRAARLSAQGVKRVVFADLGKNILAYHRAAKLAGLQVAAIGDDRFAAQGRHYRGIPVIPLGDALDTPADTVVVANSSPVHGAAIHARVRATGARVHWFEQPGLADEPTSAPAELLHPLPPAASRTRDEGCEPAQPTAAC